MPHPRGRARRRDRGAGARGGAARRPDPLLPPDGRRSSPTTRSSWPTAATSWPPPPTSCVPAGRSRGSTPASSERWGVGGGFAVGAAAPGATPRCGSCGATARAPTASREFDTCVRHGLAPIAVVGTDASWAQIARDQVEILGDDVGTTLVKTEYHRVAEGYGGVGLLLDDPAKIDATLDRAKEIARSGKPVLVNVHIAKTDFRKGSISI
ncbi:MAG: thiamine pyrophosphate-dependent enzyme [Sandaracinaceae bacterium]|nr:thiamine pyrophosphate-dependent enzyme [Sandaracinaceae bacterium]